MYALAVFLTTDEFLEPSLFDSVIFGKLFIFISCLFLGAVFGAAAGALVGFGNPFTTIKRSTTAA